MGEYVVSAALGALLTGQHACTQPMSDLLAAPQELHHFKWAGADVFVTASARGNRRCVVVETNSCPSGQKSQPLVNDASEQVPRVLQSHQIAGCLALRCGSRTSHPAAAALSHGLSCSPHRAWRTTPCSASAACVYPSEQV